MAAEVMRGLQNNALVARNSIPQKLYLSVSHFSSRTDELNKPYRDVPIAPASPLVDAGFSFHGGPMIRSYAAEPNFPGPEEPVPQPPQPELPPKKPSEPELPSPDPERAPFPGPGPTDPGFPQPVS